MVSVIALRSIPAFIGENKSRNGTEWNDGLEMLFYTDLITLKIATHRIE